MRILVIRHGESEADLLDVHEGRADFELTGRGHAQAEALGRWVSENYHLSRIYTSPLKRAHQTASHLAEATGLALTVEDDLMEFNNGLLAGLDRETARRLYPPVPGLPPHEAVYGQEPAHTFRFRAERALSRVLSEGGEEDTVAVVSHGGMINQLYRAFLELPVDSSFFAFTGDTGVHEWLVKPEGRGVAFANRCQHAAGL